MPYINTQTSTWGHQVHAVRAAHPNTSLPDGASVGVYRWYVPAPPPPHDALQQVPVEVAPAPVAGVLTQQWALQPAPVPPSITMRQCQLALLDEGVTDAHVESVIAAIADADTRTRAQIEWRRGSVVERNSPMVALLGLALALDSERIDQLFRKAKTL